MKETEKAILILDNAEFFLIAQEFLENGQQVKFILKGESMRPFLRQGDRIWLERSEPSGLRTGDILLVKWKGLFLLHRLIFKTKTHFYMAGDNNLFRLEKVGQENVVAKAVGFERPGYITPAIGIKDRIQGMLWFLLRPVRWIKYAIAKNFRT